MLTSESVKPEKTLFSLGRTRRRSMEEKPPKKTLLYSFCLYELQKLYGFLKGFTVAKVVRITRIIVLSSIST